jgi:hypothetical protein
VAGRLAGGQAYKNNPGNSGNYGWVNWVDWVATPIIFPERDQWLDRSIAYTHNAHHRYDILMCAEPEAVDRLSLSTTSANNHKAQRVPMARQTLFLA